METSTSGPSRVQVLGFSKTPTVGMSSRGSCLQAAEAPLRRRELLSEGESNCENDVTEALMTSKKPEVIADWDADYGSLVGDADEVYISFEDSELLIFKVRPDGSGYLAVEAEGGSRLIELGMLSEIIEHVQKEANDLKKREG